jgi:hypothetical protein
MADDYELEARANAQLAYELQQMRQPRTWKGYPVQPNGLPDLSSVPAFGQQGPAEFRRKDDVTRIPN